MFTENNEIGANDLPAEVLGRNSFRGAPAAEVAAAPAVAEVAAPVSDLGEMERQTILSTLASTGGHQGQAADRLGISRRTLSRKLKQYKLEIERRQGLLGSLSHEQQHYFRAGVDVPVLIRNSRGEEFSTNSINVSLGGIAVHGIDNPFQCRGPLQLTFTLADLGVTVKAHARVAWADVQGKAGIRFSEIVEGGGELEAWLAQRRQEEGWQVEDLVLK
jgi:hypothetical protein